MGTAKQNRWRSENGEIMLESSIVLVFVLLLLMALLSITFMFYQQAMLNTVAAEIAADVAKNLKYTNLEMGNDEITLDNYDGVKMYRMSIGHKKIENGQQDRAEKYVVDRVNKTSLGLNSHNAEVECKVEHSGIGRAYVTVKVTQKTDFFMSGVLEFLGIYDAEDGFTAHASAECLDLMTYTSMINFTENLGGWLAPLNPVGELYVNFKELIQSLCE